MWYYIVEIKILGGNKMKNEVIKKMYDEEKAMVKEAIALKDKAGNTQYAKDSTEASNIEKAARAKGVILTKTQV